MRPPNGRGVRSVARSGALLAALFVTTGRPTIAGGPIGTIVVGDLGAQIETSVDAAAGDAFWGTVLVARKGEVVFAKGYGFADYKSKPNAPDSLFEIASATKQVTAAAVLRLEQQGKLKTTDPLTTFFKGAPADKKAVTLRHLLTHTSGISNKLGVPYASTVSRDDYVRQMLAPALVSTPGETFAYNNAGYALLAAVVEVVTKKPFEDYVRKELFATAGMADTGFIGDDRLEKSDRVTVRQGQGPPEPTAAHWWYGWGYRGMGGVVTTALDLVKWDLALRGDKVLGEVAKASLYRPEKEGYACGWKVETTERGTRKVHHSGGVSGYAVQYSRFLDEDVVAVVLSNGKSDIMALERAALAPVFPPPRITLSIDVTSQHLDANGAFAPKSDLALGASRAGDTLSLTLRYRQSDVAKVTLPRAAAGHIVEGLTAALDANPSPASPDATIGGGLYLGPYGQVKKLDLDEQLEVQVLPRYEGRGENGEKVTDDRPLLIVVDRKRGAWPLLLHLSVPAATALRDELQRGSK